MPTDICEIKNQSPAYENVDLFGSDCALQEAVAANGVEETVVLSEFGQRWGSAEMFDQARLANDNPPKLRAFDARGDRSDVVEFHPAYHGFMAESIAAGLHASTWRPDASPADAPAEVARAAHYYMVAQVENGHMCPITMTRAAVAALATEPALAATLLPKILSRDYDSRFLPIPEKRGITLGMGMTEKQGGTDVRANSMRAERVGDSYRLTGHKWFMSAPMCDAFLMLAQAPGGLTCFLLPRFRPDGSVNTLHFQRLKDKLGNRSNASTEVEFVDAFALRVGEEGRGVRTILKMVQLTRLDCVISSAGMMRAALARAVFHCRYRSVFGKHLVDQPMMRAVLADLVLESEGALALTMRLCRAFDHSKESASEAAWARLMTPAAKYLICKTAPNFVYEAMECLGGNGYVEENTLARLFREAPVNAIWEGSGNVMCLDVLRVAKHHSDEVRSVLADLAHEAADLSGASATAATVERMLGTGAEADARTIVELLARLAAAVALKASAPEIVAAAFARTRLSDARGSMWGTAALADGERELLLQRALRTS